MSFVEFFGSQIQLMNLNTILVFITVLLLTYLLLCWSRGPKLPPGPYGLPLLGYGPFLKKGVPFWKQLAQLSTAYKSDIISVNLYGRIFVALNEYELVKDAFQKRDDMSDRTRESFFKAMDSTHEGILASSGPLWKDQRRFTLLMLRDFGMGKIAAEESVQYEAMQLCSRIDDMDGHSAFDPLPVLVPAVANIICAMAFGRRYSYDDDDFNNALKALNVVVANFSSTYSRLLLTPYLAWIVPYIFPEIHKLVTDNYEIFREFVIHIIKEHREQYDGSVNDIIDAFLVEQEKRKGTENYYQDRQLRHLIQDLFLAGSETTTTTLRWAIMYLVKYPDVQENVYNELQNVMNTDRMPTMGDRKFTPYTESFLLEVQRLNTIIPLAVPHSCRTDVQLNGYTIPADSFIASNLASINLDERIFVDPLEFLPERFLDGDKTINTDLVKHFGIGRRMCAGESLARMEIYIFFSALVMNSKFNAVSTLDTEPGRGPVQLPPPFQICAIKRSTK